MRAVVLLLFCLVMGQQTFAGTGGVVSERTYKQLLRVHELMDDARYDQALERLNRVRLSRQRPYEQALVRQTFGYLYAGKQQYPEAIEAFEKCLLVGALPETATKNVLYALAQLQFSVADYPAAIDNLQRWFELEKTPQPPDHALAGRAYAQAKQFAKASAHLRKAIASPDHAKEGWYRQLLAVYLEAADYRSAARLLEEMTRRFAERKAYWLQLSSVLRTLKDDARSLAVMELAYRRGLLSKERELIELAAYYRYMGMPYKAGKLLETALEDGALASTGRHWLQLSDAWLQAREMQAALSALQRAAELLRDAESYLRLAQLGAQLDVWPTTLRAVTMALDLGGLKQPGKAHILEGMAYFNTEEFKAAKAAFELAKEHAEVLDEAQQWLDHLASVVAVAKSGSMDATHAGR